MYFTMGGTEHVHVLSGPWRNAFDAEVEEADLDTLVELGDEPVDALQVVVVITRVVGTGEPAATARKISRLERPIATCKNNALNKIELLPSDM